MSYKIDSYHHRVFLEVFAAHGGSLTEHEFDVEFRDRDVGIQPWGGDDPLYGDMSGSDWAVWLDRLQHAVREGFASSRRRDGVRIYFLPPETP